MIRWHYGIGPDVHQRHARISVSSTLVQMALWEPGVGMLSGTAVRGQSYAREQSGRDAMSSGSKASAQAT